MYDPAHSFTNPELAREASRRAWAANPRGLARHFEQLTKRFDALTSEQVAELRALVESVD